LYGLYFSARKKVGVMSEVQLDEAGVDESDLSCLRYMVGAGQEVPTRDHGYRNHYVAVKGQVERMRRLLAAGYVVRGAGSGCVVYFHATQKGCSVIGLSERATRSALEAL